MDKFEDGVKYAVDGFWLSLLDRMRKQLDRADATPREFAHRVWLQMMLEEVIETRECEEGSHGAI